MNQLCWSYVLTIADFSELNLFPSHRFSNMFVIAYSALAVALPKMLKLYFLFRLVLDISFLLVSDEAHSQKHKR